MSSFVLLSTSSILLNRANISLTFLILFCNNSSLLLSSIVAIGVSFISKLPIILSPTPSARANILTNVLRPEHIATCPLLIRLAYGALSSVKDPPLESPVPSISAPNQALGVSNAPKTLSSD